MKRWLLILLIVTCPFFAILIWYTNGHLSGSLSELIAFLQRQGVFAGLYEIIPPVFFGSWTAWGMILLFGAVQILFIVLLPGKKYQGSLSPRGNILNSKTTVWRLTC